MQYTKRNKRPYDLFRHQQSIRHIRLRENNASVEGIWDRNTYLQIDRNNVGYADSKTPEV